MSLADDIARLEDQWRAGTLTDEEFQRAKTRLIDGDGPPPPPGAASADLNNWAMWLHFSMLSGFIVAGAGFIAPIVIWQMKKNELPGIDAHGKRAVNWMISAIIYGIICVLLSFIVIGIPLLIALGICGIAFPLIAGVKASNGEVWSYPLSLMFLKD